MIQFNEVEEFLTKLIVELSKLNTPIIFKGGIALKQLIKINNKKTDINRSTIDLDANWTSSYNEEKILKLIEKAVKNITIDYSVILSRKYSPTSSMGLKVINEYGDTITKIDLDIKDNPFYVILKINDEQVKISSYDKMLADKLISLSGEHVFRRIKDLLDVYIIMEIYKPNIDEIRKILECDGKCLGDFSTLINNKDILEDSYNKLSGIINKPNFEEIWNSFVNFIKRENLLQTED